MSQLREEEEIHGVMARVKRPRAVILLPSRDLTAQVLVCMHASSGFGFVLLRCLFKSVSVKVIVPCRQAESSEHLQNEKAG